MDKNQLDGLLALKLVADKRNFTAAAKALRISPSAISKMIRQLEARLGVTLLTRTTRATSLTEAGERFLSQAGPALELILAAMNDAGSSAEKPAGRLRLNVPQLIYPNFLKPVVASFVQKYPEVTIEIFFENAATNIFERGFDAGIRISDILAQDLVALKLLSPIRWVVAGAPEYLDKFGRPEHPKDLLSHDCICVGAGDRIYDRWEFENEGKEFSVQVKGSLIMNDATLALDAALDGFGLLYTSEVALMDKVDAGKLEIVLDRYAATSAGIYLYYPHRSQVHPKLRAFIEHVKDLRSFKSV
ncbi:MULTISPECIES: LysR substrate-binding domain-containing protein [Mesorhizobium]|uniref:LysR substrate-binding domain-containing protein n=1 Tax=Mesorhizobium sp. TaxID=1871066 RepID=UPI0004947D12|nr:MULTISPECIES: LysR substrate-binding domain-containing protein [Mesorhizobium]RWL19327.1 MAG: LysR family transcriptional regulator [Mesorhizobium sp.]RWM74637.1 MAG: LysR family transcriptional regulator [Mesorhizobium sp.]TIO27969.1 MAG: LysR family transcriptional regulator [Mesorhizobium sp.]TIQ21196.1 MAG: LysR family transcriptional regulator [Mesorhizobium sp.]TJV63320.1 MAG: LysR family transcriptional regulator [Mesorhizobium sp.]